MTSHRSLLARAALLVVALAASASALAQGTVLRVVPHSNLAILDPIWTTAYMSRNHGYMIYDTLFGTDENAKIKPQMVESWTGQRRQPAVDLQAAQGPRVPRRQAGHRRGRDRLAAALGQARRDGQCADAPSSSAWTRRRPTPSASSSARPAASCSRRSASRRRTCPSSCPSGSPRPMRSSRSRSTSAPAPTSSSATSSSRATRRCTSRTPSTCRAASRRRAAPAASTSTSTGSSGTSPCATRRRRSTR